jgi:hypothetical protein
MSEIKVFIGEQIIQSLMEGTAPRWEYAREYHLVNGIAVMWTGWKAAYPDPDKAPLRLAGQWAGARLNSEGKRGGRLPFFAAVEIQESADEGAQTAERRRGLDRFLSYCAVVSDEQWPKEEAK